MFITTTESACRYKVVAWLNLKFQSPTDADAYCFRPVLPIDDDDPQKKLSEMSHSFVALCKSAYGLEVPNDFIILATKTMIHLKGSKRSNVLYNIAKGFGEMREDQSDSRFPTDRMPMGLLEYMAGFFAVDKMRKVCICYIEY